MKCKEVTRAALVVAAAMFAVMATGEQSAVCTTESAKEEKIVPIELGATKNVTTLKKKIFFAGQPAESDFKQLSEWGIQTVINFRSKPEMEQLAFDEKKVVEALGMKYIHIPIGRERLDDRVLEKIVQTIEKSKDKKLMLHCASSNRVGFAWSLYLGAGGKEIESTIAEGKKAGLRSPVLEKRVREYFLKKEETGLGEKRE